MRYALYCILLICSVNGRPVYGQKGAGSGHLTKDPSGYPAVFESYIRQALGLWKTPGISIVVVKDDNVVFKSGFGFANLETREPFTTSTLSICASTTKAMTAVCMGMLVDEGKIKWSDKVADVYPGFRLSDNYASAEITIKDLFTHNTGLGNADFLWILGFPLDTIIAKMRLLEPAYSFRSSFIYQNLMYMVAGEVIHHVSGKPWETFIRERLFAPLGMFHTYPTYSQSLKEPSHITPHYFGSDSAVRTIPYLEAKGIDAAGAVWSCAEDIQKWVRFMLDSAKTGSVRLLKPETYATLFKPQSIVTQEEFYPTARLTKPHWTTYGLGWFQEDYHSQMIQFHTGSLDGAVAIIGLVPESHFGVYIFGNLDHSELRHALMYKAMDLWCFQDNSRDWSRDFYDLYTSMHQESAKRQSAEDAKRVLNTKPSLSLVAYCGKFHNNVYGTAEIQLKGDTLWLKYPNNILVWLEHWNFDTFQGNFEHFWFDKSKVQFSLDEKGAVSRFEMGGIVYQKD